MGHGHTRTGPARAGEGWEGPAASASSPESNFSRLALGARRVAGRFLVTGGGELLSLSSSLWMEDNDEDCERGHKPEPDATGCSSG